MRIAALLAIIGVVAAAPKPLARQADPTQAQPASVAIDISSQLNNKGTSGNGKNDGVGLKDKRTFPSENLPTGSWYHDGVTFQLPSDWNALPKDNIKAAGQVIKLAEPAELESLHILGAGEDATHFATKEIVKFGLSDGGSVNAPFEMLNWYV